jgi:hypothetical protein
MQIDMYDQPLTIAEKYAVYNKFLKSLEDHVNAVADKECKADYNRYAYLYGATLGSVYGLICNLELTDDQIRKLEVYLKK